MPPPPGVKPPRASGGSSIHASTRSRTPPRGARAPTKKSGHSGVLGFVENLGEDIGSAVLGLPAGLVHTVQHPVGTAKAIYEQEKQTWGPLTHGDVSQFLHNLYEHPLGPTLDVLTVLTLGTGSVATAGGKLAEAGLIPEASRLARLGKAGEITLSSAPGIEGQGKTLTTQTSRNPAIRARQQAVARMLKRFPADSRFVGEISRYGREMKRLPHQQQLRLRAQANAYSRLLAKLKPVEIVALHMISRGVSPRDWKAYLLHEGNAIGDQTLKVLDDPELTKLFHAPNEKIVKAYEEAKPLSELDAELKIRNGQMTEETAANRLNFHRNLVEGALGRPLDEAPLDRFYVPDRAVTQRVANSDLARMGGGAAPRKYRIRQNRGILFKTGELALHADLLGSEFLNTVKETYFNDLHNELLASSTRIPRGQRLPEGWEYVKRKFHEGTPISHGPGTPERIPYTERVRGEGQRQREELIPQESATEAQLAERSFTTVDKADAEEHLGYRLIVPTRLKEQLAGEFNRTSSGVRMFLEKPTQVWRALVLGARVGFLVNNVVGNHLLYALRFAGPSGLKAYLNALSPEKLRVLRKSGVGKEFIDEFFPEHGAGGTFVGSQVPTGRLGKASKIASLGLQITDRQVESMLRRAGVEAALRKNPKVKAFLRDMPRETRNFRDAAAKALEDDPHLQREISQQVNDALGDYLSLSAFERNAVRAVFPFYAWYRAITNITLKLGLDTPGRADLLAKIGQLGEEQTKAALGDLPSYLRGAIPIGGREGDLATVLSTSGVNPFGTVRQVGLAGASLFEGPGAFGREVLTQSNPFLQGLVEYGVNRDLFTGGEAHTTALPGLVGSTLYNTAQELPIARLLSEGTGRARPSDLYPQRDFLAELLAYLGAPVKTVSLSEASRRAREEAAR